MPTSAYVRLVERAAQILGGIEALSGVLNVPQHRVQYWLDGTITPPENVFLRLVDIVMDRQPPSEGGAVQQHTLHQQRDSEALE